MKKEKIVITLIMLFTINYNCQAEEISAAFDVYPLCDKEGILTCPNGFEAGCVDKVQQDSKPQCIYYGNKYVPGCWKFIGVNKLDLNFVPTNMPPSAMVEIIGGGETYTLNRDTIGCKKL